MLLSPGLPTFSICKSAFPVVKAVMSVQVLAEFIEKSFYSGRFDIFCFCIGEGLIYTTSLFSFIPAGRRISSGLQIFLS